MTGFRRLSEVVRHHGFIWNVVTAEFEGPDGTRFERDIVRSPGAVGVVPVHFDAEGTPVVTLIRQFRAALGAELLEIPAGMRDVPGEDPAHTASRELAEEVGLAAGHMELLTVFHNSAGMTDGTTHIYLATDLRFVPAHAHGPEEEAMSIVPIALADALAAVDSGDITDAKTALGLLLSGRRMS